MIVYISLGIVLGLVLISPWPSFLRVAGIFLIFGIFLTIWGGLAFLTYLMTGIEVGYLAFVVGVLSIFATSAALAEN